MKTQDNTNQLLIFFSHCDHQRGGEKFIFELAKHVSQYKNITLFVESISPYWQRAYQQIGVNVCLLWKPKRLYWLFLPVFLLRNFFLYKKNITSCDTLFAANFPLTLLATTFSKNTIAFCFEPLTILYDATYRKSKHFATQIIMCLIRFFYIPFDKLAIRKSSSRATLNSYVNAAMMQAYGVSADFYIPNGVDPKFFSPRAQPIFQYKNNGFFVIGHSTDYTPLKGTDYLLHSLPEVIKKRNRVLLLVSETVSNPKKKKEYLHLIKSLGLQQHVRFIGNIPQNNLPNFYTSCSIYCFCGSSQSTSATTASLSVLEAQSSGVPVLRTAGNQKEIHEGKTGFFITPENIPLFSKRLIYFTKLSPSKFSRMKKNAREYMMNFSWKKSFTILDVFLKHPPTQEGIKTQLSD